LRRIFSIQAIAFNTGAVGWSVNNWRVIGVKHNTIWVVSEICQPHGRRGGICQARLPRLWHIFTSLKVRSSQYKAAMSLKLRKNMSRFRLLAVS